MKTNGTKIISPRRIRILIYRGQAATITLYSVIAVVQNVALVKDLEIKNNDSANLFDLYQEADKKARRGEMAVRIVLDMETAYPDEFHDFRDKSRAKLAQPNPLLPIKKAAAKTGSKN